jgi:hypothetical protein
MKKYVKFWPLAVFLFLAAAALFFNTQREDTAMTDEEQDRAIWEQRQRNYNDDNPEPEDFDPIDLEEDRRILEHNRRVEERIEQAFEDARYDTYRPEKPLMDYTSMSDDDLLDEYSRQIKADRKRIDEYLWKTLRERDLIDENGIMRPDSLPDIG